MIKAKNSTIVTASVAALICLLVYLRALWCGFVTMDDPDYVLNNPLIEHLDWNLLVGAFTETPVGWWMPLTWLSFAVDYHFWGLNPRGYHLTNIVLHAVNTGFVVLIADQLLKAQKTLNPPPAKVLYSLIPLLAALLWGLHPLRVESVAWVTERKDVLNGLFTFVAVLFYLKYIVKLKNGESGKYTYIISLVCFALSLMAKSVSVVLPAMLLILDIYPLGRLDRASGVRIAKEKVPFFLLSAAMAFATVHFAGNANYLVGKDLFPFSERLVVSGHAILQYIRYILLPYGITPFHVIPYPIPFWLYGAATFTVVAVTLALILFDRKTFKYISLWLLFIIPLLPTLAFFQNGDQEFAARFTYLPAIAPSIAVALLVGYLYKNHATKFMKYNFLPILFILLLTSYTAMTFRLITVWDNSETLWTRVISYSPSSMAFWGRATYYYEQGKYDESAVDFTASSKLITPLWRPYIYNLYAYRGEALRSGGRFNEALQDFSTAIRLNPNPMYYYLRGRTFENMGRLQEANSDYARSGDAQGPLEMLYDKRVE